ncbi:hypothetical protein JL722_3043 [Aureococcus anophagefferens]|nr:hypothetical protein JL722_3043 [Aureococcus anophagefferens]
MIAHATAFGHDLFLDCVQKVRNSEIYYKSIAFYVEQQPLHLNRLLQVLTPHLDHSRCVHQVRKLENLPLVLPYLKAVQKENLTAVNDAVNELYADDEDYEALRQRTSAGRRASSSKADKMYKDSIDTCAESGDSEIAEDLLRFFVDVCDKECFCATLYTCYKVIKPDVAIELAWRSNYVDFVMPYVVQYTRHLHDKLEELDKRTAPKAEDEASPEAAAAQAMIRACSERGSLPTARDCQTAGRTPRPARNALYLPP